MHALKYVIYIGYIHLSAGMAETTGYASISTLFCFPLVVSVQVLSWSMVAQIKNLFPCFPFNMSYLTNFWPIG